MTTWKDKLRYFPATQGKTPRDKGWQQQATNDPEKIARWKTETPYAGIATGKESGIFVLDVDVKNPKANGVETLKALQKKHTDLPETFTVRTRSGGYHLYFKYAPQPKNKVGFAPGLDVRSDDGLVVAAGSPGYTVERDIEPAEAPAWLLMAIIESQEKKNGKKSSRVKVPKDGIKHGTRDDIIFRLCCSLQAQGWSPEAIEAAALKENQASGKPPMSEERVREKVAQALKYPAGNAELFPKSDSDLADRFAAEHGENMRYFHDRRKFAIYDGTRFKLDETGEVVRLATRTVRGVSSEAASIDDPDRRKTAMRFAINAESRGRIDAMIGLAQSRDGIATTSQEFDQDPWLLNVQNGTVDLRINELKPHSRADRITRLAHVTFDPSAQCSLWEKFLQQIFLGELAVIEYVRRALGYTLTGDMSSHAWFMLIGGGRNGKGTLLKTVEHLLGDYATVASVEMFLAQKNGSAGPRDGVAQLMGARFVRIGESEDGRVIAEAKLNATTAPDGKLRGSFLYQDSFEFEPTHKIWWATNCEPRIRGTLEATWRRLHRIDFNYTVKPEECDPQLDEKLRAEASGILNWALEGLRQWRTAGLQAPEAVTKSGKEYRNSQDQVRRFLDECTAPHLSARVTTNELFRSYQSWAQENGEYFVHNKNGLGRELSKHLERTKDRQGYCGIKLETN
jgi:P4 family phage/plasmid primase-like protien